jgi:hypothetical protein
MATLTNYSFAKQVNIGKLNLEIKALSLAVNLDHIESSDNGDTTYTTNIWFVDVLSSNDQTSLNTAVTNHTLPDLITDQLRVKILAARNFGLSIIDEVALDNLLAGATVDQVTSMLSSYASIMAMLQSGSLYTALSAMQSVSPSGLMTQDRITKYINQIKAYLGI